MIVGVIICKGKVMDNDNNQKFLEEKPKTRKKLRVFGFVFLGLGVLIDAIALIDFFSAFSGLGVPHLFFLFYIGSPIAFLGLVFLLFGFVGAMNTYAASESIGTATKATNTVLRDTRDEVAKTVGAVKGEKALFCPHCGTKNEEGAKFCDHCGEPLSKVCPECGEANDADSTYCRKCGKRL